MRVKLIAGPAAKCEHPNESDFVMSEEEATAKRFRSEETSERTLVRSRCDTQHKPPPQQIRGAFPLFQHQGCLERYYKSHLHS